MRGTSRSVPCTCSSSPPSTSRVRVTPSTSRLSSSAELRGVTGGLDGDDRVGADALLERGRGVEGEDLAVVHDRDPVAELVGLLHVVGGQQDRLALRR